MKKSVIATLTKDYKHFKAGETLSFSVPHYERLKEEGYFKRKVKKVAKEEEEDK